MTNELLDTEDALAWLTSRGITEDSIIEAQLGLETQGRYAGWIAIPYLDGEGRWRTTRYRSLPPADKRYMTLKGERRRLYNVKAAQEPVVAVCEGEFDSIVLQQLGLPATALPGITSWTREWRYLFRNCDLVYVITDHAPRNKEEARAAERRTANAIRSHLSMVTEVEPIEMPEGMDVTDLYLKDPDRLKELIT